MPSLIGNKPNQVPSNGDLGRLAFANTALVPAPASATAVGEKGQLATDGSYLYVCIDTNTWERVAIATW